MADNVDSDEENFEDAVEIIPISTEMDLEKAVEETTVALNLFLNNKFSDALSRMKPWADRSMYHALGYGTIMYFQAVMTFELKDIEAAMDVLKQSVVVCHRQRRKTTVSGSISKMVRKPNYDHYTDVEVHAELCYAECLLERALLTFIQDENLVSFVKGGLKIRSCYQSYKECLQILRHRSWNEKSHLKTHFESGVRMGVGAFNLMISSLPAKILKLLEFVGFSGSRSLGLQELDKAQKLKPGLRAPLCSLILIAYHTVVTYFTGMGDGDLDYATSILTNMLQMYPKGVLFLFFAGRIQEIRGNMDAAISWLEEAVASQQEWKQFHHLCFWELMWCHSFKCEWVEASHYADLLFKESRWSKATYCYQKAAFLCMMRDNLTLEEEEELISHMKNIPSYKQRIAGKSIPMEKFAVKKSQRFLQQGCRLTLPALELVYVWNGFSIIGKKIELLDPVLGLVERTLSELEETRSTNEYFMDDHCLALLIKGMCLRHMNSPLQAELCFRDVWQSEKKLKDDLYLAPFALVELGLLYLKLGHFSEATQHLETARSSYKGFSLESRLHFKIHAGLAEIRSKTKTLAVGPMMTLGNTPQPSPATTPTHSPTHTNATVQEAHPVHPFVVRKNNKSAILRDA